MVEELAPNEMDLVGQIIEGRVEVVFRWGVIVDVGLSRVGLIDVLYIEDDDEYQPGQKVRCYLDTFDDRKNKFILRPPNQTPLAQRLRRAPE